ncbi:radical SAM family protein [Desulfobotulus alkaliphilus]|uniref:Radical SAM family protein n=1 Tax=Desulfobotulus alkaliphilus TaxID=622671 RepID=A0A562S206_9BACT|nr:radical SAM protein [Desulfobotulus alkaliphilus]TWI75335.1 radical SAM family protein [Desulfobotulus alkaliphilus]
MAGKKTYKGKKKNESPYVPGLVANAAGEIFDLEGYAALGMCGESLLPLREKDMVPLPHGSETMLLPDRMPLLWNIRKQRVEVMDENPWEPGEPLFPVAAFNSPGYVITRLPAYRERGNAKILPLFAYGAVGWSKKGFASAVFQVDREDRQDLRCMPVEKVQTGVLDIRSLLPKNRLLLHIKNCALIYGCPAAKNFFLGRYEAPLPTSRTCNARCLGCISLQDNPELQSCQNRIAFTPSPREIAEIALLHIERVPDAVVSFGQGCEGDPLLAAHVIEPALRLIREKTDKGTLNMNTNASLPAVLDRLFEAGLDSMRVSMNSGREAVYNAYFQPKGYTFSDVLKSVDVAEKRGAHVALNYLNAPGVSDGAEEAAAMEDFLKNHAVHLIQWRNLNFDPLRYYRLVNDAASPGTAMGMVTLIRYFQKTFPEMKHGYFNPPVSKFAKASSKK